MYPARICPGRAMNSIGDQKITRWLSILHLLKRQTIILLKNWPNPISGRIKEDFANLSHPLRKVDPITHCVNTTKSRTFAII